MSDLSKVPVTIVTGFLGAGKTTLISHLIRSAGGRRLAVVVNEFGTLGVDGDILKGCAIPLLPGGEHRRACQWLYLLHGRGRFHPDDRNVARA
jgi:Ni2+-binding GTPase involved in maturation of urease and hydrogenase